MDLKSLVPMLYTNDLQGTIDFYTGTLGFRLDETWPDDKPQWCHMTAGSVSLMFAKGPDDAPPVMTGQLYCYPPDVDALWAQLKDKVHVEWPLDTMEYGMREFAIRDNNGYVLTFGQDAESG